MTNKSNEQKVAEAEIDRFEPWPVRRRRQNHAHSDGVYGCKGKRQSDHLIILPTTAFFP
jgi:hypothetical protein